MVSRGLFRVDYFGLCLWLSKFFLSGSSFYWRIWSMLLCCRSCIFQLVFFSEVSCILLSCICCISLHSTFWCLGCLFFAFSMCVSYSRRLRVREVLWFLWVCGSWVCLSDCIFRFGYDCGSRMGIDSIHTLNILNCWIWIGVLWCSDIGILYSLGG